VKNIRFSLKVFKLKVVMKGKNWVSGELGIIIVEVEENKRKSFDGTRV
jgi:hypothetical protein